MDKPLLNQKPSHHPQALSRVIQNETLVLNLDTGRIGVLNEVGTQVWELIDGHRDLEHIVDVVAQRYGLELGQVEQDVKSFMEALLERDMLSWSQDDS